MTALEAGGLLVETTRELSATRMERDTYRTMAQQAIHQLHDRGLDVQRLDRQNNALREEVRRLRSQVTPMRNVPQMAAFHVITANNLQDGDGAWL